MAKLVRWGGDSLGLIIGSILIGAAAIWIISSAKLSARPQSKTRQLAEAAEQQLADAARAAQTLGCFSSRGRDLARKHDDCASLDEHQP